MKKIAAVMIVFNGDHVLEQSIRSVYDRVDRILIAEGPVDYWRSRGFTTSTDNTNSVLEGFYDPDNKLRVIHSQFSEKDDQFAAALSILDCDVDYVLQLDSDEVWSSESLSGVNRLLDERSPISVGVRSLSFVGGFKRILTGYETRTDNFIRLLKWEPSCRFITHRPPTIVYSSGQRTRSHGHIDSDDAYEMYDIAMHHYSYVWPSQVSSKTEYYGAAVSRENCIPGFFLKHWLPWASTDDLEKKWELEKSIAGMHEIVPEMRGPAFTRPFIGCHPSAIQDSMPTLDARLRAELSSYGAP